MQESYAPSFPFRNKKYKNWLFELLQWLNEKEVDNVNPKELSAFLDKWIVNYYYQLDKRQNLPQIQNGLSKRLAQIPLISYSILLTIYIG